MENTIIFQCPDSIEGIFTGIYDAWMGRYGHHRVKLRILEQETELELFADYREVETDAAKAEKVKNTILRKLGREGYETVVQGILAKEERKADIVYRFLVYAFPIGPAAMEHYGTDCVRLLSDLKRTVWNEAHHYIEFIRFSRLRNGVLLAEIRPKADVLTLIAPHFADRLAPDHFMIYDRGRETAVLHKAFGEWILTSVRDFQENWKEDLEEEELELQALWKKFVQSICIEERRNEKCQNTMMPKRFREFMLEWK